MAPQALPIMSQNNNQGSKRKGRINPPPISNKDDHINKRKAVLKTHILNHRELKELGINLNLKEINSQLKEKKNLKPNLAPRNNAKTVTRENAAHTDDGSQEAPNTQEILQEVDNILTKINDKGFENKTSSKKPQEKNEADVNVFLPITAETNPTTTNKLNDFTHYNKFEILAAKDYQEREKYQQELTMDIDDNGQRDENNLEDDEYEEEQHYSDCSFKDEQQMENENMNFLNNSTSNEHSPKQERRGSTSISRGPAADSSVNSKIKKLYNDKRGSNHQSKTLKGKKNETQFKTKLPPIFVYKQTTKNILNLIKESNKTSNFVIKNLIDARLILLVPSIDEFRDIIDILKNNKIEFFTRTPSEEKTQTIMLRGLANEYTEIEVLDEINKLKIDNLNIIKVKKIKFKEFFHIESEEEAFLIQLSNLSLLKNLTDILILANQRIRWEKIRNKKPLQCHKCQRLGHMAKYCNLNYRCVKCNKNHDPGNCGLSPNKKVDNNELFCVNCNKYGHPASFFGCPIIKKSLETNKINNENKQKRDLDKINKISKFITKDKTYANALAPSTHNNENITTPKEQELPPSHNDPNIIPLININENKTVENCKNQIDNNILGMDRICNLLDQFKSEIISVLGNQISEVNNKVDSNTRKIDYLYKNFNINY